MIMARYCLSIWEMRIFQEMIGRIKPDAVFFEPAFIPIKRFARKFGVTGGTAYEMVRRGALDLSNCVVYDETDDPKVTQSVLKPLAFLVHVPNGAYPGGDSNSYVVLKFNDELKPELLQLSRNYAQYIGDVTALLSSMYAIRIYEIVKMASFRGGCRYTLKEFREIIGALSYTYNTSKFITIDKDVATTYAELNRAILKPAHAQITEKTDILFDYTPIYAAGRKGKLTVVAIRFYNIRQKLVKGGVAPPSPDTDTVAVHEELSEGEVVYNAVGANPLDKVTDSSVLSGKGDSLNLFGEQQPVEGPTLGPAKRCRPVKGANGKKQADETSVDTEQRSLYELALNLGITTTYLKIAFESYTIPRIRAALEFIQRKKNEPGSDIIRNPTGYFYRLVNTEGLEEQYETLMKAKLAAQERVEEQRRKRQQRAKLKKELKRLEQERDQAYKDINQEQINAMNEIFYNDPVFHGEVLREVLSRPFLKMIIPDLLLKYRHEYLYKTHLQHYFFEEAVLRKPEEPTFMPAILSAKRNEEIKKRIEEIKQQL